MKSISLYILSFIVCCACQKNKSSRDLQSIKIETFQIKNTSIRTIVPIDAQTVYYAGSNADVGFTTDGGKTWNKQFFSYQDTIKPHFRSMASNGKDFFVLSVENPALLYKISENNTRLVYTENHQNVFYDALQFFEDGIHGIAVGDPTGHCASIITSKDAGETWQKISCDNLPFFEKEEAFFAASNTNIKTLGSKVWIASGGQKARILYSADFGEHWQIFDTPIIHGKGPQGIYSIDFYDDKKGIIIGGDYSKPQENIANKALTHDGGKTWQLVSDGKNPNYKSCVQFVPNTQGKEVFAVGKTGISYSKDGGNSWIDISDENFYAIKFINKKIAWLSGEEKIGKLVLPNE